MNKQELKELIDSEVSKVFSDMTSKEPAKESAKEVPAEIEESKDISTETKVATPKRKMTEEDFDETLFYGGKNKKNN